MSAAEEKIEWQRRMAERLRYPALDLSGVSTIAGADTAYWTTDGGEYGVCCVAVLDFRTLEVLEMRSASAPVTEEYVPGLLAFRELPLFELAWAQLTREPDLVMFDGNGRLHPRHMGIAAQAALSIGKPALGVAKTFYNYSRQGFLMPENRPGAWTDILADGEVCGRAVRTVKDVRPVFVSPGSGMDLDAAVSTVMACMDGKSHIPAPTRIADLQTRRLRKELLDQ